MTTLVINAGPGCGKTYTSIGIPKYLRAPNKAMFLKNNKHTDEQVVIWDFILKEVIEKHYKDREPTIWYGAYNKDIVKEVENRLPQKVNCQTIHGVGYKLLTSSGYIKMNDHRGMAIVEGITGQMFSKLKDSYEWLSSIRYVEKLKEEMLDITEENLQLMSAKYADLAAMRVHNNMVSQATQLIVKMKEIKRTEGITYTDQVWLGLWKLKAPIFDIGIIDECQDLSPLRLAFVRAACRHLVFVGDTDQAINAWNGADPHAFDKIMNIADQELPLKLTFRNPPNIVKKLNSLSPRANLRGIDKPNGIEKQITTTELPNYFKEPASSAIICRYNAPLIDTAMKLVNADIPCAVLGGSIATKLESIVKQRRAKSLSDLEQKLDDYEERMLATAKEYHKEGIKDQIDCVRKFISQSPSLEELPSVIKAFFKTQPGTGEVVLSTIHKFKGREKPNIYILHPPVESPRAVTEDQKQQERNVRFVAESRTSNNVYYVVKE